MATLILSTTQPQPQQDVDKKYISKLKEIEVMFDTSSNYKNYRDRLDVIEPPLIPFQGIPMALLHARGCVYVSCPACH